eukprot:3941951-Rhodomonas_salina.1
MRVSNCEGKRRNHVDRAFSLSHCLQDNTTVTLPEANRHHHPTIRPNQSTSRAQAIPLLSPCDTKHPREPGHCGAPITTKSLGGVALTCDGKTLAASARPEKGTRKKKIAVYFGRLLIACYGWVRMLLRKCFVGDPRKGERKVSILRLRRSVLLNCWLSESSSTSGA